MNPGKTLKFREEPYELVEPDAPLERFPGSYRVPSKRNFARRAHMAELDGELSGFLLVQLSSSDVGPEGKGGPWQRCGA